MRVNDSYPDPKSGRGPEKGGSPDLEKGLAEGLNGTLRNATALPTIIVNGSGTEQTLASNDVNEFCKTPANECQTNSLPLQMIQEDEEEKQSWSRSPSIRSRYLGDDQKQEEGENAENGRTEVARAVAYLRRKSVALEDLKALEETPLPLLDG